MNYSMRTSRPVMPCEWHFLGLYSNSPIISLRIRDPAPFRPLDLGSGMGKKSRNGSGMNSPDHISRAFKQFFGLNTLKFFDADPESF
jgi:hypothetical protein